MYAQPAMFVPGNLNLEFGTILNDKHTRNAASDIKGKYCVSIGQQKVTASFSHQWEIYEVSYKW